MIDNIPQQIVCVYIPSSTPKINILHCMLRLAPFTPFTQSTSSHICRLNIIPPPNYPAFGCLVSCPARSTINHASRCSLSPPPRYPQPIGLLRFFLLSLHTSSPSLNPPSPFPSAILFHPLPSANPLLLPRTRLLIPLLHLRFPIWFTRLIMNSPRDST